MADDPGVMGNLPRSRPGRRSAKRDGGRGSKPAETAPATEVTASSARASSKGKAKPKSAARGQATKKQSPTRAPARKKTTTAGSSRTASRPRARASAAPPPQPQARAPRERHEQAGGTDPVTGAVLLAGKVVEGGLKVAGGIIKRLPRP